MALTAQHWRLLSNLVNSYDENSNAVLAQQYLLKQHTLPLKIRYKAESYFELWVNLATGTRCLFMKNQDFLGLSKSDQSSLLSRTINHTSSFASTVALKTAKLIDEPGFFHLIIDIFGSGPAQDGYRASELMDSDATILKLILAIIMFSTHDPMFFAQQDLNLFENLRSITNIQDKYADLAWRYLIHKYNYEYAVKFFSKVIRCLLFGIDSLANSVGNTSYTSIVDELSDTTKQCLGIKN